MTLKNLVRMVVRGWLFIVVAAALGAALTGGAALLRQPTYESTSSVAAVNQARVATYLQMVRSASVLEPAAAEIGGGVTAQDLATRVSVRNPAGTGIVTITGTASDAVGATRVVSAVVSSLMKQATALEEAGGSSITPLQVVQSATTPTEPAGRSAASYAVIGGAVGAVLGVVLAILWGWIARPIRSQREMEALIGAPVVGSLIQSETDPADLERALRFLAVGASRSYLVVPVQARASGDRASLALASICAQLGKRAVVIDVDPSRRRLSESVQAGAAPGLTDLLIGDARVGAVAKPLGEAVTVIPAGTNAPNSHDLLSTSPMVGLVDELLKSFDYVFMSSPRASALSASVPVGIPAGRVLLAAGLGQSQVELVAAVAACRHAMMPIDGVVLADVGKSPFSSRLSSLRLLLGRLFAPGSDSDRS